MATASSVPAGTILRTVWNDFGELWVRLRSQSIIAAASVVLLGAFPAISDSRLLADIVDLMGTLVLVPFQIAIYRLLISGEAASGYRFDISSVRFQRMLGWTAGFWVLAIIPVRLPDAVAPSDSADAIISIVLFAAFIFAVLRLTILLPAIAVDAPGASVRNAFADTSGHVWFIVKAYFIVLLPFFLISMSIVMLEWLSARPEIFSGSGTGSLAANAFSGGLEFLASTSLVIVSARLFMKIGDRAKGGPEASEWAGSRAGHF